MFLDFEMTEKLGGFASRLAQGAPKGLGLGMKVLIGASAAVYGVYKSMYTGKRQFLATFFSTIFLPLCFLVEGGHRAIIFNRIGGIDQNTIHAEGLHFR